MILTAKLQGAWKKIQATTTTLAPGLPNTSCALLHCTCLFWSCSSPVQIIALPEKWSNWMEVGWGGWITPLKTLEARKNIQSCTCKFAHGKNDHDAFWPHWFETGKRLKFGPKIVHFTVVCLVAKPLNRNEAKGDFVMIQTLLLFKWKLLCYHANWILVSITTRSPSASLQIKGLTTKYTTVKWPIGYRFVCSTEVGLRTWMVYCSQLVKRVWGITHFDHNWGNGFKNSTPPLFICLSRNLGKFFFV